MSRPANTDSAETRKRVLGAASRLFASHGVDGASVRDIALAAKVTGATVLHHFGSKEKLYEASVESMFEELASLQSEFAPALASGTDLESTLESAVRTIFRLSRAHSSAVRLLIRHAAETGSIGTSRREKQLLPFLEQGAAIFTTRTGRAPEELRLVLQSLVFLIGRWSIVSSAEASAVSGIKGKEAFTAIEDHLVGVVRRELSSK